MRSIFISLLFLFLTYHIYKEKTSSISQYPTQSSKSFTKDTSNAKSNTNNNLNQEDTSHNFEGNVLERFVSHVALNVIKTKTGMSAFNKVISAKKPHVHMNENIKINDFNMFNSLLNVKNNNKYRHNIHASCGDNVEIQYFVQDNKSNIIYGNYQKQKCTLGNKEIPMAIENLVINMRPGEIKTATLEGEYIYHLLKTYGLKLNPQTQNDTDRTGKQVYYLQVELNEIFDKKSTQYSANDFIVFNSHISMSTPVMCGENVYITVQIDSINHKNLFNDTIKFSLGGSTTPLFINYGAPGLSGQNVRTILTTARFLLDKNDQATHISNLLKLKPDTPILIKISL